MPGWIILVALLSVAVTAALTWLLYRINFRDDAHEDPEQRGG